MSMNELKIFESKEFGKVRTVLENGEPMFCLADVKVPLGLENATHLVDRLNQKGLHTMQVLTNGGNQKMTFINESNLYKVIFQSRKPEAEKFSDWVTSEVLPSIRKNGGYIANQENLTPEQIVAKALIVANNIIENQKKELADKTQKINLLSFTEKTYTATELAKECGLTSANVLNEKLKAMGFQYKVNGTWTPTAKYADGGYVNIKQEFLPNGQISYNRHFTQKGREFVLDRLTGQLRLA